MNKFCKSDELAYLIVKEIILILKIYTLTSLSFLYLFVLFLEQAQIIKVLFNSRLNNISTYNTAYADVASLFLLQINS